MKKTLLKSLGTYTILTALVLALTVVLSSHVPQAYAAGQEEISGFVYDDVNGSSSFDAGDTGRDGLTVLLQEAVIPFTQIGSTTTQNGTFTFNTGNSSISPGVDYYVYVFNDYTDLFTEGNFGVPIAGLAPDEERDGGMFGLFKRNSFAGVTFYDLNGDGIRQDGETSLANLELTLQDSQGNVVGGPLRTSESLSSYELLSGIITPGTYYLNLAQYPTSYVFTDQDVGADEARDSDVGSDSRIPVTITYGTAYANLDVGMYRANILVGGTVFDDINENGIENGEPGVNNVQVSAIDRATMLSMATTTTNSDGAYQLSVDPASCSEHASIEQDSPISIDCAVAAPGGYYQLSFSTGISCDMELTSFVLTSASGSELYNDSCDTTGSLQPNTNYSFIFSQVELGTGMANFTVSNLEPMMSTVMAYNITLTYINVFINFDNLPSGSVFTDPNIGVDTTIDSDVINSNGDTINLFAGAGDVVENIDAGLLLASEDEESSGSGSTSSGSGSTSGGGGGGGVRFARSQNTLPKISATYSPCLVTGRSVAMVFQDIASSADVDFLTSITFLNEPKRYLIKGYGDGTFGINRQLTRFELLKVALSSNCTGSGGAFTTKNTFFSDVPTDDSEKSRVVGEGYRLGIIKGVGDKFYPDQPVSYAEMIKILFSASAYFKDGKPMAELDENVVGLTDQSFTQAVIYAKRLNILPFSNETPFPQDDLVTRQEMLSVLANFIRAMRGTVMVN